MDRREFARWGLSALAAGTVLPGSALGAAAPTAPAVAKPATPAPAAPRATAASAKLAPGQYHWRPDLSPTGALVFIVSLPDQLMHVYRNGVRIGVSTCSTGKPGHRTPSGVFVILQKDKDHRSSTYNNAPMPNMQRLTWSGVALHAGNLPGYPASHGCVRLPKQFSQLIFGVTQLGIPVIIADRVSQPEVVVHPGIILPAAAQAQAAKAMTAAAAARTPKDVMSAVVSGRDRVAIVMIDGRVIWDSPIDIVDPGKPLGESSFTLLGKAQEEGTYRWMAHTLKKEVVGRRDSVLSRIKVKRIEDQRRMLASAQGSPTLVVTDAAAGIDTRTRADFVVIDAIS